MSKRRNGLDVEQKIIWMPKAGRNKACKLEKSKSDRRDGQDAKNNK